MNDVDLVIAAVAARRHGVFNYEDVRAAGGDRSLVSRRVKAGRWERVAPRVFRIAGSAPSWEQAVAVAVLRLSGVAAASHRTAAHIHGLWGRPRRIEVVTNATGVRHSPVIVHQCRDLVSTEIAEVGGIAVTDVARTIIDIGVPAGIGVTQVVLDGALRAELTSLREVAARIHRYGKKGRRGIGPARQLVAERLGWDQITDSVLEDAFLRLAARAGLPTPTCQRTVVMRRGGRCYRLDFDFGRRLVVELDSEKYHLDAEAFRYDRRRQNELVGSGMVVLRFTWWDVMAAPDYVVATIAHALRMTGVA